MSDAPLPVVRSTSPRPRYQPFVIVVAAVAAGILLDRFLPLPLAAWSIAAVAGLILWRFVSAKWRTAVVRNIALLAAVAAVAGAWHHCRWHLFPDDDLGRYATRKARPICVEAIATEVPRMLPPKPADPMQVAPASEGAWLTVKLVSLRNGAIWQPASGRARLLINGKPPNIEAGDRLRCFVQLSSIVGPRNPGAFDRAAYLRADRVRSRLTAESPQCITVIKTGSEWNLTRQLQRIRAHGNQVLERYLNQRRAELAAAVLLGFREELDDDRNEAFLTTGTIHVLSISGLHVGVLAGVLFWIVWRMPIPRGLGVAVVATITVLYSLMVDVGPPVIRATILVLVACVAVWRGRRPLGFNTLAAAALVVLALNPAHLFNIGAQLSFLCIAGLIWFATWGEAVRDEEEERRRRTLDRLIAENETLMEKVKRKTKQAFSGVVVAGGGLWLLTFPLVLARFHILSLAALGLNVLLWPFMTLSLISGFGVLLFGTLCPPLGWLCGWICDVNFWLLETGVNLGHRMPGGHYWMPGPADWWLWGFYAVLLASLAVPRMRRQRRVTASLLTVWIVVGFAVSVWPHNHKSLDCTFLSMEHGCAVFIESPSGKTMLYDAGQMSSPSNGARTIANFLWDRGLTHVDTVVLSHPDIDHYNALPELLDKFSVGTICVTPAMLAKGNRTIAALHSAIDRHGVTVREVRAGDRVPLGDDCPAEVLHPARTGPVSPGNTDSLVLAVEYRGRRIVLPGDLETPGLNDMLKEKPRACEVLMAPHHGSRKSNSAGLAAWCKPRLVVFSGDGRWNLSEIDTTYRAVGGRSLHTHECGAIRVQIDAEGVRVSEFVE